MMHRRDVIKGVAAAAGVAVLGLPKSAEAKQKYIWTQSLIAVESGDWSPRWTRYNSGSTMPLIVQARHGSKIVSKWHEAMRLIQHQLDTHPPCLAAAKPDVVEVHLLDANEEHWLNGEEGFEAGPLSVEWSAAFDSNRHDMINLVVTKRIRSFQSFSYALNGAPQGSLFKQEMQFCHRRDSELKFIRIVVTQLTP